MELIEIGGVNTTEVCNLTCVMCHFNGPNATRRQRVLTTGEVRKFVGSIPPCQLWFASTGDFLMDPHALDHLRAAVEAGHQPCILTNGQLFTPELIDQVLEIGVREIAISVDAIEPDSYRRIRRGGELGNLLRVCQDLKVRKARFPGLKVGVINVLFRKTLERQEDFIRFWTGKVDRVTFQAEYYDTFKFRNTLYEPGERVDCQMRVFLLPNGQMSPCCAMTVYQHEREVEWLPHIANTTPEEALQYFKELYADSGSPLGKLCGQCQWWMMFKHNENGETPFTRVVELDSEAIPDPAWNDYPDADARPGVLDPAVATASNGAAVTREEDGSLVVTTPPDQWAYACLIRLQDRGTTRLADDSRLWIRVRATVETGRVGVSVAASDLKSFVAAEQIRKASPGPTFIDLDLEAPEAGQWLVVRNTSPGNLASTVRIHEITVIAAPPPVAGGFIGIENLTAPNCQPPPIEIPPTPPPPQNPGLDVFETPEALAINRARMDHLAALRLPVAGKSVLDVGCGVGHLSGYFVEQGCRVDCVDARAENLERLRALYPGRPTHRLNVEFEPLAPLGRFDVVFCFGLLYHCENPIAALRNMASVCDGMLLLETVVTDHPRPVCQLVDEPPDISNQAVAGFGSRPSPAFVAMALSRMGFRYIYTTRTRPAFADFQVEWKGDAAWTRDGNLLRCVFIASRQPLDNPSLELLVQPPAGAGAGAGLGFDSLARAFTGEVWIDVGAHSGESTFALASRRPDLRVFAFEPNLPLAATLMGRLPNYLVFPMAVADRDGSAPFYLNRYDAASSLLPFNPEGLRNWTGGEQLEVVDTPVVPTIRLDTFMSRMGIRTVDYLHVDAQGADLAVVRSAGDRLRDIRRIQLEVQLPSVPLYAGAPAREEVVRFLALAGFELESSEKQSYDQEENLTFVRKA